MMAVAPSDLVLGALVNYPSRSSVAALGIHYVRNRASVALLHARTRGAVVVVTLPARVTVRLVWAVAFAP